MLAQEQQLVDELALALGLFVSKAFVGAGLALYFDRFVEGAAHLGRDIRVLLGEGQPQRLAIESEVAQLVDRRLSLFLIGTNKKRLTAQANVLLGMYL